MNPKFLQRPKGVPIPKLEALLLLAHCSDHAMIKTRSYVLIGGVTTAKRTVEQDSWECFYHYACRTYYNAVRALPVEVVAATTQSFRDGGIDRERLVKAAKAATGIVVVEVVDDGRLKDGRFRERNRCQMCHRVRPSPKADLIYGGIEKPERYKP